MARKDTTSRDASKCIPRCYEVSVRFAPAHDFFDSSTNTLYIIDSAVFRKVLDVGSGSGVLAIFAAQAGAKKARKYLLFIVYSICNSQHSRSFKVGPPAEYRY